MKSIISSIIIISLFFTFPLLGQMESTFMRVDADPSGYYVWFGGTVKAMNHSFVHEIIYFPHSNYVETEIGPYFSFAEGKFDVCPMIGPYMNISTGKVDYLLPQLYIYSTINKFYFEAWNIYYLGMINETKDIPLFYGRYFSTYSVNSWLGVGPHLEFTVDLSDDAPESISSLQYGAALTFPYGDKNSMVVFLGAENKDENRFVSRFTFLRYF